MMRDQVYARALLLAGEPDAGEREVLRLLCGAVFDSLEARLREGMMPEDCREAFVTAAALEAAAELKSLEGIGEFRAGDLTVKSGETASAEMLRHRAERLMAPYLKDRFLLVGV